MKTLKQVADAINADPSQGLVAKVEKTRSSTDSKIAGSRLCRVGKGRSGNKLTVTLVRTGEKVCEVDTSQTYQQASDAVDWFEKWRAFHRTYHRVPAPNWNQTLVEGEPVPTRGKPLTREQLLALPETEMVWVKLKEPGESFLRMNEAQRFTRKGGTQYLFEGWDLDVSDSDVPQEPSAPLVWTSDYDGVSVALYLVRLVPHREKKSKS